MGEAGFDGWARSQPTCTVHDVNHRRASHDNGVILPRLQLPGRLNPASLLFCRKIAESLYVVRTTRQHERPGKHEGFRLQETLRNVEVLVLTHAARHRVSCY